MHVANLLLGLTAFFTTLLPILAVGTDIKCNIQNLPEAKKSKIMEMADALEKSHARKDYHWGCQQVGTTGSCSDNNVIKLCVDGPHQVISVEDSYIGSLVRNVALACTNPRYDYPVVQGQIFDNAGYNVIVHWDCGIDHGPGIVG